MEQQTTSLKISVIIMAFNEAKSLAVVVREIDLLLSDLGWPYEVVIINDGSSDGTGAIADQLAKGLTRMRVVHHEVNQGLGGVYRTGFAHARGDFVTFFPADRQFPPAIIKEFASLMENMDVVLGYLPNRGSSLLARSLSKAEKVLYRFLFGPLPEFQGILMFRRTLLNELELKSTGRGWTVLMELIIRASRGNYRLVSVPTEMRPRINGRSKVTNFATIWANLKQTVALCRYL